MLNVLGYQFDGPYSVNEDFNNVAGVYIITTPNAVIVDVGETENLKDRIPGHERRQCWIKNGGTIFYFHREVHSQNRLAIESLIRNKYNPACGVK